jgi:hypothetical protein
MNSLPVCDATTRPAPDETQRLLTPGVFAGGDFKGIGHLTSALSSTEATPNDTCNEKRDDEYGKPAKREHRPFGPVREKTRMWAGDDNNHDKGYQGHDHK